MPTSKPRRRSDPDTVTLTLTRSEADALARLGDVLRTLETRGVVTLVRGSEPAKPRKRTASKKARKTAR